MKEEMTRGEMMRDGVLDVPCCCTIVVVHLHPKIAVDPRLNSDKSDVNLLSI